MLSKLSKIGYTGILQTMNTSEYVAPVLAVDSVIFQLHNNKLEVLLIERQGEPFKGMWALPGGYINLGETTRKAMDRVLEEKAGVLPKDLALVVQLYTFDTIARDPRGHAVSVTYIGVGRNIEPLQNDTVHNPAFFPVSDIPEMAFDHADIITYAHERLKAKFGYTNACFALLDKEFTLSQLQAAYEAVLVRTLDKRNFRKKFLALGLIEETDKMQRDGAHRPARLYRFKNEGLQTLTRSFD